MLFNSFDFAVFLPIVFIIYWLLKGKTTMQNVLIVAASYLFYGWWDWRFLSLIVFSTLVDYFVGRNLRTTENKGRRRLLLWVSILVNLGFLGFFKYYNFFLDNFVEAFTILGYEMRASSLNIILPVGISFYTFQTLSYTIDIYRKKLEPTKDLIGFSAYVSFFPQLVAGPIERATNLLPQFVKKRTFVYADAVSGMRQILWGFFKKVVIADNCAALADEVFNNYGNHNSAALFLGAILFTFQIYGDFSGYSDIAIGTAKLFGFKLKKNFAFPYFSRDIAEFWRRWHISLSTWFRDYLYIPLGGSQGGQWSRIRNTFVIFIVSGFWHGANWTFIFWGALNAVFFLPLLLTSRNRNNVEVVAQGKYLPSLKEFLSMTGTFLLCVFAWIFFRAESLTHAFGYIGDLFASFPIKASTISETYTLNFTLIMVAIMLVIEWLGRTNEFALERMHLNRPARWFAYASLLFIIGMFMKTDNTPFIYFQF